MNIRETLGRQTAAVKGTVIGVLALLVGIAAWASMSSGRPRSASSAFYTTDDGQSTFIDDFFKPYPFEHDGRQAFRAYVYQTDKGDRFVGYIERYSDEGVKQLTALLAHDGVSDQTRSAIDQIRMQYAEVKKANDPKAHWVPAASRQAQDVESPVPPGTSADGAPANCILVFP